MHINESSKYILHFFQTPNSPTGGALLKPCDTIKLSVYYGMKKMTISHPFRILKRTNT